jgi:hypothetical protein
LKTSPEVKLKNLREAALQLLSDIETMSLPPSVGPGDEDSDAWFGDFSEYELDLHDVRRGQGVVIEWPNLKISADNLWRVLLEE